MSQEQETTADVVTSESPKKSVKANNGNEIVPSCHKEVYEKSNIVFPKYSGKLATHVDLPSWFKSSFPLLSNNEYFRSACDEANTIWNFITSFIAIILLVWGIKFYVKLWTPFIIIFKYLVIFPWLKVLTYITHVLGLLDMLRDLKTRALKYIDQPAAAIVTVLGNAIIYFKDSWKKITSDLKGLKEQLRKEAEQLLKTAVIILKYLYEYVEKIIQTTFKEDLRKYVSSWLRRYTTGLRILYNIVFGCVKFVRAVVNIVTDTWKEQNDTPSVMPASEPKPVGEIDISKSRHRKSAAHDSTPARSSYERGHHDTPSIEITPA